MLQCLPCPLTQFPPCSTSAFREPTAAAQSAVVTFGAVSSGDTNERSNLERAKSLHPGSWLTQMGLQLLSQQTAKAIKMTTKYHGGMFLNVTLKVLTPMERSLPHWFLSPSDCHCQLGLFPVMVMSSVGPFAEDKQAHNVCHLSCWVPSPWPRCNGVDKHQCAALERPSTPTAAGLGHALQPHRRLHRLLCPLGEILLPEGPFTTIMGFISEITCFPMTENIKF